MPFSFVHCGPSVTSPIPGQPGTPATWGCHRADMNMAAHRNAPPYQNISGRTDRRRRSVPVPTPQGQQGRRPFNPGMATGRHGDTGQRGQQHHSLFPIRGTNPRDNAPGLGTDGKESGRRGKSHGRDRRKTTHRGVSREPSGRACRMLLLPRTLRRNPMLANIIFSQISGSIHAFFAGLFPAGVA